MAMHEYSNTIYTAAKVEDQKDISWCFSSSGAGKTKEFLSDIMTINTNLVYMPDEYDNPTTTYYKIQMRYAYTLRYVYSSTPSECKLYFDNIELRIASNLNTLTAHVITLTLNRLTGINKLGEVTYVNDSGTKNTVALGTSSSTPIEKVKITNYDNISTNYYSIPLKLDKSYLANIQEDSNEPRIKFWDHTLSSLTFEVWDDSATTICDSKVTVCRYIDVSSALYIKPEDPAAIYTINFKYGNDTLKTVKTTSKTLNYGVMWNASDALLSEPGMDSSTYDKNYTLSYYKNKSDASAFDTEPIQYTVTISRPWKQYINSEDERWVYWRLNSSTSWDKAESGKWWYYEFTIPDDGGSETEFNLYPIYEENTVSSAGYLPSTFKSIDNYGYYAYGTTSYDNSTWYDKSSDNQLTAGSEVNSDIKCYAKWTPCQFKIRYNLRSGESWVNGVEPNPNPITTDYDACTTKSIYGINTGENPPYKMGCTFKGWTTDISAIEYSTSITAATKTFSRDFYPGTAEAIKNVYPCWEYIPHYISKHYSTINSGVIVDNITKLKFDVRDIAGIYVYTPYNSNTTNSSTANNVMEDSDYIFLGWTTDEWSSTEYYESKGIYYDITSSTYPSDIKYPFSLTGLSEDEWNRTTYDIDIYGYWTISKSAVKLSNRWASIINTYVKDPAGTNTWKKVESVWIMDKNGTWKELITKPT